MENTDLKWIKEHYGENFSCLCQDMFPSILKKEGVLPRLLKKHFLPSQELYDDILICDCISSFRDYVYKLVRAEENMAKLGLSFNDSYKMLFEKENSKSFKIPNYVQATDGKFYKYNQEISNIFYCPNNVIIQDKNVYYFNRDKSILFDHFILDFEKNKIIDYNLINVGEAPDFFPESVGKIKAIKRMQGKDGLTIVITPENGELVEIALDKRNQIVGYSNPNIEQIDNNFLFYNRVLTSINLPKVQKIGNGFLDFNRALTSIDLPKVEEIGNKFLYSNKFLTSINLPKVKKIGDSFLCSNKFLTSIDLPKVVKIGDKFLYFNNSLRSMNISKLQQTDDAFLEKKWLAANANLSNTKNDNAELSNRGNELSKDISNLLDREI